MPALNPEAVLTMRNALEKEKLSATKDGGTSTNTVNDGQSREHIQLSNTYSERR